MAWRGLAGRGKAGHGKGSYGTFDKSFKRCGRAGRGRARLGSACLGMGSNGTCDDTQEMRLGEAWRGKAWRGKARAPMEHVTTFKRYGRAWHGLARRGKAGLGKAWVPMEHRKITQEMRRGSARPGQAWRGKARAPMEHVTDHTRDAAGRGGAWPGEAGRGQARQGLPWSTFRNQCGVHTDSAVTREKGIAMNLRDYEIRLVGSTALLMHRDDVEQADMLSLARKKMRKDEKTAGDDRSPAWTWHTYVYHDGKYVACPADNIIRSMCWGGSKITYKKQATFKQKVAGGISFTSDFLELWYGPSENRRRLEVCEIEALKDKPFSEQSKYVTEKLGFYLDVRRAGVNGKKHVRVRPKFKNWELRGIIRVSDADITQEVLSQILTESGFGGIMDGRPSSPKSPLSFGQFTAKIRPVSK